MVDISTLTLKELTVDRPDLIESVLAGNHEETVASFIIKNSNNDISKWTEEKRDIDDILISKRVDKYAYNSDCIDRIVMQWYGNNQNLLFEIFTGNFLNPFAIPTIQVFPVIISEGVSRYVNKDTGNDFNTGESGSPYATIEHGISQLLAGDTLVVHEAATPYIINTANEHNIALAGTSEAWITIEGAGGERPIIGTDYTESCASNCPRGFRIASSARYIYIKNFAMKDFLYTGIEILAGAKHIVVDDVDIDSVDCVGVDITSAEHLYFRGVNVVNSGYRDSEKRGAFLLHPTSQDIVFENCTATSNHSSGFRVYGWTGEIVLPYDADDSIRDLFLVDCTIRNNGSTQANFAKVFNLVVKNCTFADGINHGKFTGLKFWGKYLWLINSVFYSNHIGLQLPSMYGDANAYILNNTFIDNKWTSIFTDDYRYIEPGIGSFFSCINLYLYNNIFHVIPNIYYSEPHCCCFIAHTNGRIVESNNNLFFGQNNERLFSFYKWISEPYNREVLRIFKFSDFNGWKAGTSYSQSNFDNNSICQFPLSDIGFVDMANNNYRLSQSNPAIKAGVDVGAVWDADGNLRNSVPDIGAHKYVG